MKKHECTSVWNPNQKKHYCGICGLQVNYPLVIGMDFSELEDRVVSTIVSKGESGVISIFNPYGDEWDEED